MRSTRPSTTRSARSGSGTRSQRSLGGARRRCAVLHLLGAFPDIRFDLTDIVIGPQGVCEEASVAATHLGVWRGVDPSGEPLRFRVVIFFPWDRERRLFRGERVYTDGFTLARGSPLPAR